MKKRKSINRNLVIFIVCSFLSIVIFFSSNISEIKYFKVHFSNFFSLVFSPKKALNDLSLLRLENDNLINEIKKIRQENLNLNQRIRTINSHQDYDKKLDKLIPNHKFIPAKVLSHSLSKSINIFNINVGTKDGISTDYKAVINYDGNLVGKTWVVTEFQTQIHKISDRNFNVYVQTDNNIFGQFSYKSGRLGVIESVSKSDEHLLEIGDIFYTTQSSSIYPENIPVAKVIDIKNRPNDYELYIKVEILANLNGLRNVFIIE